MADIFVGLDPSLTAFGVAVVSGDGVYEDTWLIRSAKRGVDRLLDISYQLTDTFADVQQSGDRIVDVAMEDTVRSSFSASALGELAGVTKTTCHTVLRGRAQYPLRVPPTTLKKFATGRGNAKKAEILLSVYKKWGREILDDNEADAYVLARIASGHANLAYEREILSQLRAEKFRDGGVDDF